MKNSCNFLQRIHLRDSVFTLTSLVKVGSVRSIFFPPREYSFWLILFHLGLNFFIFVKYANLISLGVYFTRLIFLNVLYYMLDGGGEIV